jgi:hypothetical protein
MDEMRKINGQPSSSDDDEDHVKVFFFIVNYFIISILSE